MRPSLLSARQKQVIEDNIGLFPSEIKKFKEFSDDKITIHMIRGYQKKILAETVPEKQTGLLYELESYLRDYGLPSRFHGRNGVTGFIEFLRSK